MQQPVFSFMSFLAKLDLHFCPKQVTYVIERIVKLDAATWFSHFIMLTIWKWLSLVLHV